MATDINTDVFTASERAKLEVRHHDIATDDFEEASFDLILVRYLLTHLVGRQRLALDRLVRGLRPGGWLVVEESDSDVLRPADAEHPAYEDVRLALEAGNAAVRSHIDIHAGRLVARHPQLIFVGHEARATLWAGGSIHAQFLAETNARTRAAITPPPEIQARLQVIEAAYADPTFLYLGELRHRILARRRSE